MNREFHIPGTGYIRRSLAKLSFLERSIVLLLFTILCVSVAGMLYAAHKTLTEVTPAPGGSLTEGIVGTPRFINPLLAQTEADKDLTMLAFSGLMRAESGGTLALDLAKNYTISEDGTVYTFELRDDLKFHDNSPITAHDVVFTVQKTQDPTIQSPRQITWEGIEVAAVDDRTVQFILGKNYSGFLNNTTLGIIPSHIWEEVAAEDFRGSSFNENPIGSGPFSVDHVRTNSDGAAIEYTLKPFSAYEPNPAYLSRLSIKIFGNEKDLIDAYKSGDVDAIHGVDPFTITSILKNNDTLLAYPLPRTFGLFLNHNRKDLFTHEEVRKALSYAIDRNAIVTSALNGFATPITDPIPPYLFDGENPATRNIEDAREILENNSWEKDADTGVYTKDDETLSFTIKTVNTPELKFVAELVQSQLNALGASVSVEFFELGQLNQNVIKTRDYEVLLFGQVTSREGDPYPFWHSSQRNDPGLNVALYTNSRVDAILDQLRSTLNIKSRKELFASFLEEWRSDVPAIFIYIPDMLYVLPDKIQGVSSGPVQDPSERFLDAHKWFINTQRIFTFLTKENS